MKKLGLLLLVCIMGLFACEKDHNPPMTPDDDVTVTPEDDDDTVTPEDDVVRVPEPYIVLKGDGTTPEDEVVTPPDGEIVLGDGSDVRVTPYNTLLLGAYSNPHSLDLDLDNDNAPDVRLISEVWGSPELGHHPRSRIQCLNNHVELLGYFKNDTSFLHRSIRTEPGPNNTSVVYEHYTYSCFRTTDTDSVLAVNPQVFKVQAKNAQELVTLNDTFESASITLIDDSYGVSWGGGTTGNIIVNGLAEYHNDCNSFPDGTMQYIAFKVTSNETERLGWIKVRIANKREIFVVETAIEG